METETLKNILDFLKQNENRNIPFMWKLKNNEPFTEEELNIKGNLDLVFTRIKSLPDGLKVGGNLNLTESYIESLPEGLEVGGEVSLGYTNITSLPDGFEVGGRLYLNETKITSLPKGLKVGGNLHITRTPLRKYKDEQLREMIKPGVIKGKIIRYR